VTAFSSSQRVLQQWHALSWRRSSCGQLRRNFRLESGGKFRKFWHRTAGVVCGGRSPMGPTPQNFGMVLKVRTETTLAYIARNRLNSRPAAVIRPARAPHAQKKPSQPPIIKPRAPLISLWDD